MWQEILVIIIAIIAVLYVALKIYRFFITPASTCDKCEGCSLKEQISKKNDGCNDFKRRKK